VIRASARIAGAARFVHLQGRPGDDQSPLRRAVPEPALEREEELRRRRLPRAQPTGGNALPEIELNRLEQITDVTDKVKAPSPASTRAFKLAKNAVEAKLSSACVGAKRETARCDVVDLYSRRPLPSLPVSPLPGCPPGMGSGTGDCVFRRRPGQLQLPALRPRCSHAARLRKRQTGTDEGLFPVQQGRRGGGRNGVRHRPSGLDPAPADDVGAGNLP